MRLNDQTQEFLKLAVEGRKLEIENFWRRSLFFWGFIVASFAGYAHAVGREHRSLLVETVLLHFGLICSFCWYLINKSGKYWVENWEQKIETLEGDAGLFSTMEPLIRKPFGGELFSPSRIMIFLSEVTTGFWLFLITGMYLDWGARAVPMAVSSFTVLAALVSMISCRSRLNRNKK